MSRPHVHQLTQGDVIAHLRRMTWPLLLAMVLLMTFNFVDAYFVSLLGTKELAAFSFTFPVTFTLFSVVIGLGIGTSAAVATAQGKGQQARARALGGSALALSAGLVLVLAVPVWFGHDWLFRALGAKGDSLDLINQFMSVWLLGVVFITFPMIGNAVMRANGNTRLPSLVMAASAFVNAALDPLFIFGWGPVPAMGLKGAALATVCANLVSSAVIIYMLVFRMKAVGWFREWSERLQGYREILAIALPAAGSNILTPLAMGLMTAIMAGYGEAAVAAFGVGTRLESLSTLVVLTLSMSLPPLISQNAAAGHMDRVRLLYRQVIKFVLLFQGGVYLLLLLSSGWIGQAFGQDAEVAATIALLVSILPLSYGAQGVIILSNSSFNALHRPLSALGLSVIRLFVMYLPLAYIGGKLAGLTGVFVGAAVANVLTALIAWRWVWYHLCCNRDKPTEAVRESTL
ncbi:MATE family efflux transporter [Ferrimonas balearica]|uniref:MATE family efflux transporter n=1 Tax=Ferrimonas balearica TaxID=44012 RepID=UPI001C99A5C1|nr:MATE family efflux transporter [Ferrimonas balearica]MBY5920088.1 MATE family efflux transporter [Ferrimonas balearica]MBY5997227.1 MATE family efflux transporter [Ferrimonas balearica]